MAPVQTCCRVLIAGLLALVARAADEEPLCLSRYDYDYKMLEKTFILEQEQKELRRLVDKQAEVIARMETGLRDDIQSLVARVQDSSGRGPTYVRWGRTTCPENGTDTVYSGFAGGSQYSHSGAAVNPLCLPTDPQWAEFDDSDNGQHTLHGAEYEVFSTYSEKLFKKRLGDYDVPCAVCHSSRTSQLVIPGRTTCYDGWTLEFSGYLAAGHHSHPAATEFVCLDREPELIPNSETVHYGKLFYMVEASCGSLKCPPYVQGRELPCVVCTK